MKFRLRCLQRHYVLSGVVRGNELRPDPRLPRGAQEFWRDAGLLECDGGVVAWHNGRVVGFCRYGLDVDTGNIKAAGWITMMGTWVSRRYRRHGLAIRMWRLVLRRARRHAKIKVVTLSPEGAAMVRRLRAVYPRLRFHLYVGQLSSPEKEIR